jgi:hypothetical protein
MTRPRDSKATQVSANDYAALAQGLVNESIKPLGFEGRTELMGEAFGEAYEAGGLVNTS